MYKLFTISIILGIILACAGKGNTKVNAADIATGEQIYKKYCVICHGQDGKLGVNGSKDITVSLLTLEERVTLIKLGKTTMTPFEGILSDEEIKAVAAYTMQMK